MAYSSNGAEGIAVPIDDELMRQIDSRRTELRFRSDEDVMRHALQLVTSKILDEVVIAPDDSDFEYLLLEQPDDETKNIVESSEPTRVEMLDLFEADAWGQGFMILIVGKQEAARAERAAELCGIQHRGRYVHQAIRYFAEGRPEIPDTVPDFDTPPDPS